MLWHKFNVDLGVSEMASKKMRGISLALILIMMLASCKESNVDVFTDDETKAPDAYVTPDVESDSEALDSTDREGGIGQGDEIDNPFIETSKNPVSLVLATADTESYKHFRDLVNSGYSLSELKKCSYSFKNEEFLNYFSGASDTDSEFYSDIKISPCSWNKDNYLLKFTLASPRVNYSQKNNFVLYVDVSESMGGENMLPAITHVGKSFSQALLSDDIISIVTSESENNVILDSAYGNDSENIIAAIESLEAHGSSSNHDSLEAAFEIAKKNYMSDGQNTVIIISDGDISKKYGEIIKKNADEGIKTSVIALGSGNYKNQKLESLADIGGGKYYYVDGRAEAELVLSESIFYVNTAVASKLSVKVDFNSSAVDKYRLIGYEGKVISEDADNGADENTYTLFEGDNITLCYEISLADNNLESLLSFADITVKFNNPKAAGEIVKCFYADADSIAEGDGEMELIMCAIESLMVLRSSPYGKNIKLTDIYNRLSKIDFEEYPKAEELYSLLGIITGKIKK